MAIAWAKEYGLVGKETKRYKENWVRGQVLENSRAKLFWDFEFNLRKTTSWRLDLILEDKERKKIWICDMACPQQANIAAKEMRK